MAFPTIAGQTAGTQTSNSTSWTVTYPGSIGAGDLLLLFVGHDGNATCSATGFTVGNQPGDSTAGLATLGRKADGTETGTFTLTLSGSEQGCWLMVRITGWEGTNFSGIFNTVACFNSNGASGSSTAPNPDSANPTNWDVEDTLWFAVAANDGTPTYTGKDANYTYVTGSPQSSGGAGGAGLAVAYRENAVASEDPGAYTLSASEGWGAVTVAIRPAAAAAAGSLVIPHRHRSLLVR